MADDYICPDWSNAALVLIDVQNDFAHGSITIEGTAERLPDMGRLAAAFRAAGRPIIHMVRLYRPGSSDVDTPRRAAVEDGAQIVAPDTEGAQICPDVLAEPVELDCSELLAGHPQAVGPDEVILYKPRWSAFYRTRLDAHLQASTITTVVVAGCNLPNCPRATLFDASERDYRTVLVTDATSQATAPRLDDLGLIGVVLSSTDAAVEALSDGGS